mmetsp:Transcript_13686/g.40163  ORF Transcript_13686/g.40163 Transcript_13686/m.40163 type:complete len:464 (-) Transcript_13686:546-1937(-)
MLRKHVREIDSRFGNLDLHRHRRRWRWTPPPPRRLLLSAPAAATPGGALWPLATSPGKASRLALPTTSSVPALVAPSAPLGRAYTVAQGGQGGGEAGRAVQSRAARRCRAASTLRSRRLAGHRPGGHAGLAPLLLNRPGRGRSREGAHAVSARSARGAPHRHGGGVIRQVAHEHGHAARPTPCHRGSEGGSRHGARRCWQGLRALEATERFDPSSRLGWSVWPGWGGRGRDAQPRAVCVAPLALREPCRLPALARRRARRLAAALALLDRCIAQHLHHRPPAHFGGGRGHVLPLVALRLPQPRGGHRRRDGRSRGDAPLHPRDAHPAEEGSARDRRRSLHHVRLARPPLARRARVTQATSAGSGVDCGGARLGAGAARGAAGGRRASCGRLPAPAAPAHPLQGEDGRGPRARRAYLWRLPTQRGSLHCQQCATVAANRFHVDDDVARERQRGRLGATSRVGGA